MNEYNEIWYKQPLHLFRSNTFLSFIPNKNNTLTLNVNIIVKNIILLTIFGYITTKELNIVYLGIIGVLVASLYYMYGETNEKQEDNKEGFEVLHQEPTKSIQLLKANMDTLQSKTTKPTKENPLMNVQPQQIQYEPKRPKAEKAYKPKIEEKINENVKKNLDPRLFKDLGDEIDFENSMRQFYTTANSQIPNDQNAFAKFCYGDMISCRGGDDLACVRNNERYIKR